MLDVSAPPNAVHLQASTMAFNTVQLLAAAMLLSMSVSAMAAKKDAPKAELESTNKYGYKGGNKEEYPPRYPKPGEQTFTHSNQTIVVYDPRM